MTYTHDEVRAIVKFVLEEERRLDAEEKNEAKETAEVTAEEKEKPSAPERKKPGPKPKKKQPLDHGKIMALHKGNWPVAKIADEMGCSEQAVRNHIAQETAQEGKKDGALN